MAMQSTKDIMSHLTNHFLQNSNWLLDPGLHIDMLNNNFPPGRNEFYDTMLSQSVRGKKCIDIGFGVGLLSLMAIKHGAISVEAWEMDETRYQIGKHIINALSLNDKIRLNHGQFVAEDFKQTDYTVLHEIVGPKLWDEGMRKSLPIDADIYPSKFRVDFEVLSLDKKDYLEIFFPERKFNPEVELLPGAVECIQSLIDNTPQFKIHKRDHFENVESCKIKSIQEFYYIDLQLKEINGVVFKENQIPQSYEMDMDVQVDDGKVCMLYPKIAILHKDNNLFWSYYNPLLVDRSGKVTVHQDFDTGFFKVSQES